MKKRCWIVSLICALVLVLSLGLAACNEEPEAPIPTETVATPVVTFIRESFMLSWDEVENAEAYEIRHNETTFEYEKKTSVRIVPVEGENVLQVRALGDNVTYAHSEWSAEITFLYELSADDLSVYGKVNNQIMKAAYELDMDFVRVVGISDIDSYELTEGKRVIAVGELISFETVWLDYGDAKHVRMNYFVEAESTEDALEKFNGAILVDTEESKTVTFDSAQCLLDSGSYVGHMEELREQGYAISVIDSVVLEGRKIANGFEYFIAGTYMAAHGDTVTYFTAVYKVTCFAFSSLVKDSYVYATLDPDAREVIEDYLVIHEEAGTLSYMAPWLLRR